MRNAARVNEDLDQRTLLRRYEGELRRLRAELQQRQRDVVDKRQLLQARLVGRVGFQGRSISAVLWLALAEIKIFRDVSQVLAIVVTCCKHPWLFLNRPVSLWQVIVLL